ncbi:acylneuraminate cytidylyltransferase family protein [Limnobacter sp.]|uniref:acylneuraminate cytidylyltransferase family protein n=1 Tax=Limnobacter sp. TaxID=2003368 RepID=UPI00311FBDB3
MGNNKVLAIITARGGSKGLPRKNVLLAAGKPLIAWTVEAALAASVVNRVVLSSDDDEIISAASAAGCDIPFRRPPELATDKASSMDVVFHALHRLPGYEFVVLLQPTSPMRTAADIEAAFHLMKVRNAPACVSVSEVDQSPYWMYSVQDDYRLTNLLPPPTIVNRRQDLPRVYTLNGAIYIAQVDWLLNTKSFLSPDTIAYRMPKERSIDIDNADDFQEFKNIVELNLRGSTSQ